MLEHHGHAGDGTGDKLLIDDDIASINPDEAVETAKQCRFAAAARAYDGDDLASPDLEIDVAEDFERTVALAEPAHADAVLRIRAWACSV